MFTGIITHLGTVTKKTNTRLTVATETQLVKLLTKGMSISVDGICLTVVSSKKDSFSIDFMPETAKKSNINSLEAGSEVNLELPATPTTLLAGHIVQGHVDAVGKITSIKPAGNSHIFAITIPKELSKYIVDKGSISVNGISLTVISITDNHFTIGIIPHTWEHTMLRSAKEGDHVNIEVDAIAKHIEKLVSAQK